MIVKFVEIGRFPVLLQMFWWFYTSSLKNEKFMIKKKLILHLRDAKTSLVFTFKVQYFQTKLENNQYY